MNEDRLINIEAKIAYQEDGLQQLSDVIYRQQKQIDQLENTCQILIDKIKAVSETVLSATPQDEKPPHY